MATQGEGQCTVTKTAMRIVRPPANLEPACQGDDLGGLGVPI